MSQIIGKVGMTPRGMYERTRAYERLDVVTYQGSSWVAIVDVPAQISPALGSDYWQLQARMGETGPQGPVGPQGNSAFMNDGTVNKYELVNNLTQGGENAVLSAEQGKILKQELTELESKVGRFLGNEVSASASIQKGGNRMLNIPFNAKKGDNIYVRIASNTLIPDGANAAALYENNDKGKLVADILSNVTYAWAATADISNIYLYFVGANMTSENAMDISVAVGMDGSVNEELENIAENDIYDNSTINVLSLESGGIDYAGNMGASATRVRTKDYIWGKQRIKTRENCIIYSIAYYSETSMAFDSIIYPKSADYIVGKDGCVAKITFAASDEVSNISVSDIKTNLSLEKIYDVFDAEKIHNIAVEVGAIEAGQGLLVDSTTRIRTIGFIDGEVRLIAPSGYLVYTQFFYDKNTLKYISYNGVYNKEAVVGSSAYLTKVVFAKTNSANNVSLADFRKPFDCLSDKVTQKVLQMPPMVEFSKDTELKDVSAITDTFDMTYSPSSLSIASMMEQVYAKFDALASAHPNYIERVDAFEEVKDIISIYGFTQYPIYTRLGGQSAGKYEATPSYKIYLYKLIDNNVYVGNSDVNKKGKILLIGGTHGIEVAGSVNSYILAEQLCKCDDDNLFRLRQSFDIYIVPCLNGYGVYHQTRQNANGVDINRNFPVPNWAKSGNLGDVTYSGETPSSEFEACLVMSLTKLINPDIAIDHHAYWPQLSWNYYTDVFSEEHNRLCYQALVDCSLAFIKGLPQYFGTAPKMFVDFEGDAAPRTWQKKWGADGTMARWWACNDVLFPTTIEINSGISYLNGVLNTHLDGDDLYSKECFSVAEYTLRSQLLKFSQWVMANKLKL